jgi:glutamine synthetase
MTSKTLTQYLLTDLCGVTRGRGVWAGEGEALKSGVGWVPVNQLISPFDTIPSPNPWGSHGDSRLHADPDTLVDLALPAGPRVRFALCDLGSLDGASFDHCSRSFLRRMLARLETHGLRVLAAFEQEFWLDPAQPIAPTPGFSWQRAIRHEPFGSELLGVLEAAGVAPEMLLPEFAERQFELTLEPAFGLVAADRAVVSREIVRAAAFHAGHHASFAPLREPGGVGSGVHVHLSLWDESDAPILYDPEGPAALSRRGQAFCAGIVAHMDALCALTAPAVVSYERLQPHRWSSAYTCMGDRNREATLRVCPIVHGATPPERQFNVEYRAADGTANPYLVLGGLIAAGLDGLDRGLAMPPLVNEDPSERPEAELATLGIRRLPSSLGDALAALEGDAMLGGALGAPLLDTYLLAKRGEIAACEGLDAASVCTRYAAIF